MHPNLRRKGKQGLLNKATASATRLAVALDSQSTQGPPETQSSQSFETELQDLNAAFNATPSRTLTPSYALTLSTQSTPAQAAIAPSIALSASVETSVDAFEERFLDNFDGIIWSRLPEYTKPMRTQKHKKSTLYELGYRVALRADPSRIFFVCRHCHLHRAPGQGICETTSSTSAAWAHVEQKRLGHGHRRPGKQTAHVDAKQLTLASLMGSGVQVPQEVSNALGNFNQ